MVLPLALGVIGFGLAATVVQPGVLESRGRIVGIADASAWMGLVWGAVGAFVLLASIRFAKITLDLVSQAAIGVGIVTSTWLSIRVFPTLPLEVDPLLTVEFGIAWIPAAVGSAVAVLRSGVRPSTAFNVASGWIAGGLLALPSAMTFGVLVPRSNLGRNEVAEFGGGDYATIALVVALIGFASLLAALSRLPGLLGLAGVLFFTLFSGAQVGFTIPGLIDNFASIVDIPNFWPPDFGWAIGDSGTWWWLPSWEFGTTRSNPLIETFQIAILAALVGCGTALPLAFMASKITAPTNPVYLVSKGFMNFIRTIPDLFWALLFVTAVGTGPFSGALALAIFSLAIMAKLLSETVDAVDPGPLEAAKATGSKHFPAVRSAVLPQVLPNYVAYGLYIFEITIRASAVLGLVGAGGIGRVIETQRSFFRFDRVLAIIIVIFTIVFVIEQISVALRRRLV
ncbi:MAG: phosphonate ABC transporter, permease protein PhnE [Acidimicrobiia bacterium]|nr:phosphonate ABC transporter, permease protein PhnE [Acidimicrobiia bacterium]